MWKLRRLEKNWKLPCNEEILSMIGEERALIPTLILRGDWGGRSPKNLRWGRPMYSSLQYFGK